MIFTLENERGDSECGCGWNACEDLTHDPTFGAVCGLQEADVRAALGQLIPDDAAAQERVFQLMRRLYGGYRFPAAGGGVTEPLFHTQMCVFFFRKWLKPANGDFRDAVLNRWSRAPEHADLKDLVDPCAAGGETVMRAIAKHPSLPLLQTGLASTRGHVYASVSERLRLRELLRHQTDPPEPVHPLATFMYHHGLVTRAETRHAPVHDPPGNSGPTGTALAMPNRGIADPLVGLFSPQSVIDRLVRTIVGDVYVADVIDRPTSEKVWRLMSTVIRWLHPGAFDRDFVEASLEALFECVLKEIAAQTRTFAVACEAQDDPRRAALRLSTERAVLVVELKRLRPTLRMSDGSRVRDVDFVAQEKLRSNDPSYLRDLATARGVQLAVPHTAPAGFREVRTVVNLRDAALEQAKQSINADDQLRRCGKTVSACGVVHWNVFRDDLGGADWRDRNVVSVSDVETIFDGGQHQ